MQFQKRLIKVVAMFLCALTITFSITSSCTIPAYAADANSTFLSLEKTLDMVLTRTGIVSNSTILQQLQASILNMLNGTASTYTDYCNANGLEKNGDSWAQYLDSDAYMQAGFVIPSFILNSVYFIDWMCGGDMRTEIMESDAVQLLAGTSVCTQGEEYVIEDEAVEYVREEFDTLASSDEYGFYYIDIHPAEELNRDWFADDESYNNAVAYVNSSEYVTALDVKYIDDSLYNMILYDNSVFSYYVRPNKMAYTGMLMYDNDFNLHTFYYKGIVATQKVISWDIYDSTSFYNSNPSRHDKMFGTYFESAGYVTGYWSTSFYSKTGGKQKIYNSLKSLQVHEGGNVPYYTASNIVYDSSVDNSMKFTGDYIVNNGDQISYDIVQTEIDNSVDNSVNTVQNIVDNSTTTIVNNYYYTTPDSGGDSGGSDDGGDGDGSSSGGGLGSLIDGIGSLLNFVITLIGDVLSLIGSFLDTVYDMIKNLGGSFTNFSGLMGELFTFIPQDLMDLIEAGIGVAIVIVIWKMFRS